MRVIIAGGRDVENALGCVIAAAMQSGYQISCVVSGTARGVDRAGEIYAQCNVIPVKQFPANWDTHGKSAGYKRNAVMAENADALIAVWDGQSRGTKHMVDIAVNKGLRVFIYNPSTHLGYHRQ